jgi:hypothetical protein
MRLHVVDRWQHLGTAEDDSEVEHVLRMVTDSGFDADGYRIIRRVLASARPRDLVLLRRHA